MIVSVKTRRAAVLDDEPTATFVAERIVRDSFLGNASLSGVHPARATVEILRQGGGMMPRALLGGIFEPGGERELVVLLHASEGDPEDRSCASQLASPLVPGLPMEFAEAVMDGLKRGGLPGGRLVVDRAAFDKVESSPMAFGFAAELLVDVLHAKSIGLDVGDAVQAAMEAWQ